MAEYNSLPELRGKLTVDNPDERASAYQSVLQADLEVSDVLSNDPPVSALEEAGVIPQDKAKSYESAAEYREQTVELLQEIRDAVSGGQ